MANAIFEDLEIDFHDMLSNPVGFAERVYAKADELRSICKADISVNAFKERYKNDAVDIPSDITDLFNSIYTEMDELPLEHMLDAIKQAKKLVSDLETAFTDRCIRQAAKDGTAIGDKRLAHAQYTRLKDDFNLYVKSIGMFAALKDYDLKQLPNLPGNYGGGTSSFIHYVFEIDNEQYRNHHIVCRKLGIDLRSLVDLLDYIAANPELNIIVTEVQ